jgi:hypothetical protein
MGFEGRSDHCFGTVAFHRVQHPEADLESRIGSPVAEDQHGCCSLDVVGDIDGARRRMDFGSRYGDRNTLTEEVHRNRMPRFANVAVVAAVAAIVLRGSLLTPTKAVVGVAFAHPVDLRDIWRNKDPVVPAVLVVRRDLSWKMVHHLHLHREVAVDEVGSAYPRDACWNSLLRWQKIHGFQPPRWDCGRILRQRQPRQQLPTDSGVRGEHCCCCSFLGAGSPTGQRVSSIEVGLRRVADSTSACCGRRLETGCVFVLLFGRSLFDHPWIPLIAPREMTARAVGCLASSCCWAC